MSASTGPSIAWTAGVLRGPSQPPASATSSAHGTSHVPPAPRLLLAEDDRDLRELLCAILEAEGATVVAVSNGREALDELKRDGGGFHAAILDVRMPLMTGLDVLRESRRLDPVVPVILVTSFADDELRERARELGAACVVDKPLAPEQLRQAIGTFARRPPDGDSGGA